MTYNKFQFDQDTYYKIVSLIEDYEGGEIFFGCTLDHENQIIDVEPICYGSDDSVLAPYEIVKNFNAILHNHPSGNIKPSEPDMYYANYLQNEGIGFFITDNQASKINIVVPPIQTKKKKLLDIDYLEDIFSENGLISKNINNFELRTGQKVMSSMIAESFNKNDILVVEAGTGIGKSIAYLIPSFLWAEKNKERIIVSTNTINLQNQLINKDIPLVKKILNSKINAVLVKGRRNYVCKLKIYNMQNELDFDDDSDELNNILNWSSTSANGDIDELNFIPKSSLWEKVSSEADFCLGKNCLFFQNCFFQLTRRKASESNILVVNHHLLFADLEIRSMQNGLDDNTLLPPYRKIVFDEAHNILKSASSFFSISISKKSFLKFLSFIKKKNDKGFLPRFLRKMINIGNESLNDPIEYLETAVYESFGNLINSSARIFDELFIFIEEKINFLQKNNNFVTNHQLRIKKEEWQDKFFEKKVLALLKKLMIDIEDVEKNFESLLSKFEPLNKNIKDKIDLEIKLLKSYQNKLSAWNTNITGFINNDIDENIVWIEANTSTSSFKITATPLNIDKILCNNLHSVFDSIIFCSATLTVNNSFDFFKTTTGLSLVNLKNIQYEIIESPFDFKNNVLFATIKDMPEPNDYEYNESINEILKNVIKIMNGSTFALFTSYNQLKKSYESVNEYLNSLGLRCFYQGEMEKYKLLEKFIAETSSNLFATNSFWEGVDAPGKTLRCVILSKLPFTMPTEPVEEARVEALEKKGINSFLNYSLPSAVIRFRQGFGRLIRKKDDYGVILLLDSRILKKSYGKIFLNSVPSSKIINDDLSKTLDEIENHISLFEK